VAIPASANGKYAIYDAGMFMNNSSTAGIGGMLTFLDVTPGTVGPDLQGPGATGLSYSAGNVIATINDAGTGGSDVAGAEYFIDTIGADGAGFAMNPDDGAFDSPTEVAFATVSATNQTTLNSGAHTIYVHGQDSAGNWGPVTSLFLTGAGNTGGPVTYGLSVIPSVTNGSVDVTLRATGDDTATGGSNVTQGEYRFDSQVGGTPYSITPNQAGPVVALDTTIPAATIAALSEGPHTIYVRSFDGDLWGDSASIAFNVDKTAPAATGASANPSSTNGNNGVNSSVAAVRVTVTLTDSGASTSNIAAGEGFIDAIGADGTGFILLPNDGVLNSTSETMFADIPLTTIGQLADGAHTVYLHGKDAAGNWGATSTTTITVDKTAPVLSAVSLSPNPTSNAASVTLTATATDNLSNVTAAEYYVGTDPGVGAATAFSFTAGNPVSLAASINSAALAEGTYTVGVRAKDAAGNWSTAFTVNLQVTHPLYFSTSGTTNPPGVGGSADDADIYLWNGAFSRVIDASAAPYSLPSGANVDGFVRVDSTHFYMSFTGNVTIPIPGPDLSVADEDVVYYNAGTWSIWFDGSALGLNSNIDLDAISIVGGTLYFSTDSNNTPPGVTGGGDDADIYRWNGGNSYTRMIDASAVGWSTANVDGLRWVDSTHVYLSYSVDTTVPGIGGVQDEDVVFNDGGSWSVYFDGTAKGLTSGNLDVDAFDLP
jgi:hypothetical protein